MNKGVKILAPGLVLGSSVMSGNALAAGKGQPEKKEEPPRPISLYVDEVKTQQLALTVSSQGEVQSTNQIQLVAEVNGRVMKVSEKLAAGAEFEAGEVLASIDDTPYRLAVTQAESQVAEAEVGVARELANAEYKKEQWKYKNPNQKPSDYALNIPQVVDAKSKLKAAQAALSEAKRNLAKTQITVPFRGRVLSEDVGVGQYISAGQSLAEVFAIDQVEVPLALTDHQLNELQLPMGFMAKNGQGPEVTLKAEVGGEWHEWQGRIIRTQAAVDKETRLIDATAVVNDPYGLGADDGIPLAVGMFVMADIDSHEQQQALVLPRDALRNKDKVFIINEDNRLEVRTVEVLATNAEQVMIKSGVAVGEWAVTSSSPGVVDGVEVVPIKRTEKLVSQL